MKNRVPLVIEVVSTNWSDDYAQNRWYEAIGIALRVCDRWHEGKRHSPQWGELQHGGGSPPAALSHQLLDWEIFSGLELTTDAIFQAAGL